MVKKSHVFHVTYYSRTRVRARAGTGVPVWVLLGGRERQVTEVHRRSTPQRIVEVRLEITTAHSEAFKPTSTYDIWLHI